MILKLDRKAKNMNAVLVDLLDHAEVYPMAERKNE